MRLFNAETLKPLCQRRFACHLQDRRAFGFLQGQVCSVLARVLSRNYNYHQHEIHQKPSCPRNTANRSLKHSKTKTILKPFQDHVTESTNKATRAVDPAAGRGAQRGEVFTVAPMRTGRDAWRDAWGQTHESKVTCVVPRPITIHWKRHNSFTLWMTAMYVTIPYMVWNMSSKRGSSWGRGHILMETKLQKSLKSLEASRL